jgi:hypothetical protein
MGGSKDGMLGEESARDAVSSDGRKSLGSLFSCLQGHEGTNEHNNRPGGPSLPLGSRIPTSQMSFRRGSYSNRKENTKPSLPPSNPHNNFSKDELNPHPTATPSHHTIEHPTYYITATEQRVRQ